MPIRNPFARRPAALQQDEHQRPGSAASEATTTDAAHPGFERVDTVGSKASPAFSIRSSGGRRSQDTGEYKMSVVNDSGVYLPPSPVEKEATWPRRYLARTSSDRSSNSGAAAGAGDIEHFSISRESFDSYRRSFDISAKSPVVTCNDAGPPTRQSLDSMYHRRSHQLHQQQRSPPFLSSSSSMSPRFPRSSLSDQRRWEDEPPLTPEESERGEEEGGFYEDVGLGDENAAGGGRLPQEQQQQQATQKKRGFFFGKFGSDSVNATATGNGNGNGNGGVGEETGTAMSRFLPATLGGGKRRELSGGVGAEMGAMPAVGLGVRQAQEVEV